MKRVLFLEDDPDLREVLQIALPVFGDFKVRAVSSVPELRAAYTSEGEDFSSAILDINLGLDKESGLDGYRWLKEQGFKGQIIFFTGHARFHPLVQQACGFPGVHVIEKPIQLPKIAALLLEGK